MYNIQVRAVKQLLFYSACTHEKIQILRQVRDFSCFIHYSHYLLYVDCRYAFSIFMGFKNIPFCSFKILKQKQILQFYITLSKTEINTNVLFSKTVPHNFVAKSLNWLQTFQQDFIGLLSAQQPPQNKLYTVHCTVVL